MRAREMKYGTRVRINARGRKALGRERMKDFSRGVMVVREVIERDWKRRYQHYAVLEGGRCIDTRDIWVIYLEAVR